MRFIERNGRRYAQFEQLGGEPGLTHAFSTRPFDLSARIDADAPRRSERRANMARDFDLNPARLHYCVQIHQTHIANIERGSSPDRLEGFDAAITQDTAAALMTFSADCPLILAYDPVQRALGMAHASWRCCVAGIAGALVCALCERFGCEPENLLAGIGPSAGPGQYEVKQDVYDAAAQLKNRDDFFTRRGGRMFFDLWRANRSQLEQAGIRTGNIECAEICTMTHNDVFYSFRREGRGCGHFALIAALREESA